MITAYKLALGPLLLLQGRRLRGTALRLPEAAGPRAGRCDAGVAGEPLRVLFVGDSSAAGVGVDHQDEAMASQAAALLSAKLARPVEWQLLAQSGVNTRDALALLAATPLQPADLLVTALGVNDVTSQRSGSQFLADYGALLDALAAKVGARFAVVNGVPPLHVASAVPQPLRWYLGQCARRLDAALTEWVASRASWSFVSLQWAAVADDLARDGFHPGKAQYERWAHHVSESASQLLRRHVAAAG